VTIHCLLSRKQITWRRHGARTRTGRMGSISPPLLITKFAKTGKTGSFSFWFRIIRFSYQTYSTKSDILILFQSLDTSSRLYISDLGRTYPMYQTYLAFSRVSEPCHLLQVRYIQPRTDKSDTSEIFDHMSGSRTVA
jgi:hypothetical protein